ncbi:hypothetical protein Psi02_76660 [Planotetraspora silvatica]|uniref:Uncharacterized protein n=1 Tax=Planotetraspora silvatica TaxID=234614 RepID=A0A8J3UTV8_9ACTN|nr:hypothetical protein Psi02_76660 [Planotetraspora silvatica]
MWFPRPQPPPHPPQPPPPPQPPRPQLLPHPLPRLQLLLPQSLLRPQSLPLQPPPESPQPVMTPAFAALVKAVATVRAPPVSAVLIARAPTTLFKLGIWFPLERTCVLFRFL